MTAASKLCLMHWTIFLFFHLALLHTLSSCNFLESCFNFLIDPCTVVLCVVFPFFAICWEIFWYFIWFLKSDAAPAVLGFFFTNTCEGVDIFVYLSNKCFQVHQGQSAKIKNILGICCHIQHFATSLLINETLTKGVRICYCVLMLHVYLWVSISIISGRSLRWMYVCMLTVSETSRCQSGSNDKPSN